MFDRQKLPVIVGVVILVAGFGILFPGHGTAIVLAGLLIYVAFQMMRRREDRDPADWWKEGKPPFQNFDG